jgi:hypothetical protein
MVDITCFQGELRKLIFLSTKCRKTKVDHKGSNPLPLMSKGESNFIEKKHHLRGSLCMKLVCFPQ